MDETHDRPCKGIWIPIEIWDRTDLSPRERILWAEISAFTMPHHPDPMRRGCFASNAWLAAKLGVSQGQVANLISGLVAKGLVVRLTVERRRQLVACFAQPVENQGTQCKAPVERPHQPQRTQAVNPSACHSSLQEKLKAPSGKAEGTLQEKLKPYKIQCEGTEKSNSCGDAAPPKERPRNPAWDALAGLEAKDPAKVTRAAAGCVGRALRDIREVMPEMDLATLAVEITRRAAVYRGKFPGAACTALALAKHWAGLEAPENEREGPRRGYARDEGVVSVQREGDIL